jgi:hypothetical protein
MLSLEDNCHQIWDRNAASKRVFSSFESLKTLMHGFDECRIFPTGVMPGESTNVAATWSDRRATTPAKLPVNRLATNYGSHLLAEPLLQHGSPRHKTETLAIVEHHEAAARQLHRTSITARHLLVGAD